MTTATPERTVTPLYDQELEAVVWDEAKCEDRECDAAATWRVVSPECADNHCTAHMQEVRREVILAIANGGEVMDCGIHGTEDIDPRTVRFEAI